ncbi:MAG: FtsQ-type POTRA domain-containing protein [Clostridia bacterium]|nr:FtsQ-type POTRA domain-containing protein [Clostridia bacterium]
MEEFKPNQALFGEVVSKIRRKMNKVRVAIVLAVILSMMLCFLMVFVSAYQADDLVVKGLDRYEAQAILDAAKLSNKSDLITFDPAKAEKRILESCPYVRSVEVVCDYPNGVNIKVNEEVNIFVAQANNGSYVVLSDELRVLEVTDDKEYIDAQNFMKLSIPGVEEPEVGKKLSAKDGRDLSYAVTFLQTMLKSDIGSEISGADVSEKFNLSIQCGSHVLYFGSAGNLDTKLQVAYKMMEDGVFSRYSSALCNISNPDGATVRENTAAVSTINP